jgi:hypothetical protein
MQFLVAALAGILGFLVWSTPLAAADKITVGWIENVRLHPSGLVVQAKLDSGAEYSSLDARNLAYFKRGGAEWVKFQVISRDGSITLERPVLRQATIKRHFGRSQKRPVIKLGVCLGKVYKETEVNLVDRSGFLYRMLIGRKFMENAVIIDPGVQYTVQPGCGEPPSLE